MSVPLRFLPEAREEYDESVDFFEGRRPGLGESFIKRVRVVLDRIRDNPKTYPIVYSSLRQATVRKFPYTVIYQEEPTEVLIVAIFHGSRNPSVWKARIQ